MRSFHESQGPKQLGTSRSLNRVRLVDALPHEALQRVQPQTHPPHRGDLALRGAPRLLQDPQRASRDARDGGRRHRSRVVHRRACGRALDVAGDDAAPPEKKPRRMPRSRPKRRPHLRVLPNGRGFLRLVTGGETPPSPPRPPAPIPTPAARAAQQAPAEPSGQLDLFAWRPKPREPEQLDLFGPGEE